MTAAPDLVALVSMRIAGVEMARRIPDWDGPDLPLPSDLPPLTMLAGRAFPETVLERRLRFLRVMGWYPDEPPAVVPGVKPPLPLQATIEDHLASWYGAANILGADGAEGADPALGALAAAVRNRDPAHDPLDAEMAALEAFFDTQADAVDPLWRSRTPSDASAVTAWARVEAATLHGDRFFGRRRPGRLWTAGSDLVWRLAEQKRRWRG